MAFFFVVAAVSFDDRGEGPLGPQLNSFDDVDAIGVLLGSGHVPNLVRDIALNNLDGSFDQMDSTVDSMVGKSMKTRKSS